MQHNPLKEDSIEDYFEDFVNTETLISTHRSCLHLRITNTGIIHLKKLDVRIQLHSEFALQRIPDSSSRLFGLHESWRESDMIYFPTRDEPLDTAPGASALYFLLIEAPDNKSCTNYCLNLRIASEATNGFIEKKLLLILKPVSDN